jgi:hypothetical protein
MGEREKENLNLESGVPVPEQQHIIIYVEKFARF